MEYTIEFSNESGQKLYGIMHTPTEKKLNNAGVIIFNYGLDDRVGLHRLNLKIARALADKGHYVLRFDPQGIGFSEGKLETGSDIDNYIKIQKGIFLNDAIASINFLTKEVQPGRIVLIGLCGGAVTALAAAARDKRIETVILVDVPVYLDQNVKNIKDFHSLSFWKRIFLGKLDIIKIIQLVFIHIKGNFSKIIHKQLAYNNLNTIIDHPIIGRLMNKRFIQDFLAFISSKRKILFIMAESNVVGYEFNNKFKSKYLSKTSGSLYKVIYVKHANHVFHSLLAQNILLSEISSWITECRCNDFKGGV